MFVFKHVGTILKFSHSLAYVMYLYIPNTNSVVYTLPKVLDNLTSRVYLSCIIRLVYISDKCKKHLDE